MSDVIVYAECKECGGHEEIQDLKDAKDWVCAECTWDIIIEREQREIYKHV